MRVCRAPPSRSSSAPACWRASPSVWAACGASAGPGAATETSASSTCWRTRLLSMWTFLLEMTTSLTTDPGTYSLRQLESRAGIWCSFPPSHPIWRHDVLLGAAEQNGHPCSGKDDLRHTSISRGINKQMYETFLCRYYTGASWWSIVMFCWIFCFLFIAPWLVKRTFKIINMYEQREKSFACDTLTLWWICVVYTYGFLVFFSESFPKDFT